MTETPASAETSASLTDPDFLLGLRFFTWFLSRPLS
jgi:hypothetical protein